MTYDSLILEIHKALINNFTDNSPHLSAKGRSPAVREYITKIQKTAIAAAQDQLDIWRKEGDADTIPDRYMPLEEALKGNVDYPTPEFCIHIEACRLASDDWAEANKAHKPQPDIHKAGARIDPTHYSWRSAYNPTEADRINPAHRDYDPIWAAANEAIDAAGDEPAPEPQPEQELTEAEVKANRDAADKYHDSKQEPGHVTKPEPSPKYTPPDEEEEGHDIVHYVGRTAFLKAPNGDLTFMVAVDEGKEKLVFSYKLPEHDYFQNQHFYAPVWGDKYVRKAISDCFEDSTDEIIRAAHTALALDHDSDNALLYSIQLAWLKGGVLHHTDRNPICECNETENALAAHFTDSGEEANIDELIDIAVAPWNLNFIDRLEHIANLITDALNVSDSIGGEIELNYALTKACIEIDLARKLLS